MKDEGQLKRNRTIRNCSTCNVLVLDKGKKPSQCYKADCWLPKFKSLGDWYAEDINYDKEAR